MDVLCNTSNFNFILYLFIYYFELRLPPSSEVWFVQERYVTFGCSSQSTTRSILNLDGSVERLECNMRLRRSLSVWKTWAWDRTNWPLSRAQTEAGSSGFAPPKGELTNHKYIRTFFWQQLLLEIHFFHAGKSSKHVNYSEWFPG